MTYYTDPIMHIDYDRIRYPKHSDAIFDWEQHHQGFPEHNNLVIDYLKQCRKNEEASIFGGTIGSNYLEQRSLQGVTNNPLTNSNGSLSLKPGHLLAMSGDHGVLSRANVASNVMKNTNSAPGAPNGLSSQVLVRSNSQIKSTTPVQGLRKQTMKEDTKENDKNK